MDRLKSWWNSDFAATLVIAATLAVAVVVIWAVVMTLA
jgi:hypothetical protein